jgi:hypothetical protein
MPPSLIQRRVRIAAILVFAGLLVELLTLLWLHPLAFLTSAFIGAPLVGLGILVFLYSLVSVRE